MFYWIPLLRSCNEHLPRFLIPSLSPSHEAGLPFLLLAGKVMDFEGIKALLERAGEQFVRLSHLRLDAGYRGEDKGKDWVEKALGWSVELVERPRKLAPEEVLRKWAEELAKEARR